MLRRLIAFTAFFIALWPLPSLCMDGKAIDVTENAYSNSSGQQSGQMIAQSKSAQDIAAGSLDIPAADLREVENNPRWKELMGAKGQKGKFSMSEEVMNIRPKALEETAVRVGFQEGYAYRYRQIEKVLKKRELALDSVFNFGPFLLENGKVMPPVIVYADSLAEIRSPDEMIETGTVYKIQRPAQFVTVQPSWRDFLLVPQNAITVEKVHPSMYPQTSKEQAAWRKGIAEGWIAGMEYAEQMFETGVNAMMVDLKGIIQYKMLEKQGYISMPQISRGHLAIRVGSENLEFDQRIFRITERASFKNLDREKQKKVNLAKEETAGKKISKPKNTTKPKPVIKKTQVQAPKNTSHKLTLPEKEPAFKESDATSVRIDTKTKSPILNPEDIEKEGMRQNQKAKSDSPEVQSALDEAKKKAEKGNQENGKSPKPVELQATPSEKPVDMNMPERSFDEPAQETTPVQKTFTPKVRESGKTPLSIPVPGQKKQESPSLSEPVMQMPTSKEGFWND